jgi:hypothetical protein
MTSKKTMATHPPSAAEAANKAARQAGKVQYRRGRRPPAFDWATVTPEARAAAIAAFKAKTKGKGS